MRLEMKNTHKLLLTGSCCLLLAACSGGSSNRQSADTLAPEIAAQSAQIQADSVDNVLSFSVQDNRTALSDLQLSVMSSDEDVLKGTSINLIIDGENTFLSVSPEEDMIGSTDITITATDEANNTSSISLTLDVLANQIAESTIMSELIELGENEEPIAINSIELSNDIDGEEWFDSLFL